jgi:hypothetical protein
MAYLKDDKAVTLVAPSDNLTVLWIFQHLVQFANKVARVIASTLLGNRQLGFRHDARYEVVAEG